ncbi:MAG: penicillin-binding protein 2 [bacterium]|nr:penicillin-binding protein 2 [bacterium]
MVKKSHIYKSLSLSVLMIGTLVFLLGRLFYLQVQEHEKYFRKAEIQQKNNSQIEPRRGFIFDRNRKILAMSVESQSLFADPFFIKDPAETSLVLSGILGLDAEDLKKKLESGKRFVWIKRKLDNEESNLVKEQKIEGLYFVEEMKRRYPLDPVLSNVIGFADIDNRGLEGLELVWDDILRGRPGWRASRKDGSGKEIISERKEDVPAINGNNLVLTVDSYIQHVCETALREGVEENNAIGGCALVMDVNNGNIIAMANYPTYLSGNPSKSPPENRRNRCITDIFEPGSTFKVLTGAAALDKGAVSMKDIFDCENGKFPYGGFVLHDAHPYGMLTFKEVIQKSSNIGIAKVAMKMGEKSFYEYLEKYGFGKCTGVGLPGEVNGILRPLKQWSKVSITRIPMGQGISVTPIQLISAFSSVVNGGKLFKPRIVARIESPEGKLEEEVGEGKFIRVVSEAAARDMVESMCAVVSSEGTALKAKIKGYSIGGKTGTAQKVENGKYSHEKFFSSFIGFATATKPSYAVLVVIDEPKPRYYGGTVAAPVFRKIMEVVLSYYEVPLDRPEEII